MGKDWLSNPQAVANIKQILNQMGFPLENRAARICRRSVDALMRNTIGGNSSAQSGRLVYENSDIESAAREIDYSIEVHDHLDFGNDFDTRSEMQILIECKHRDDLGIFGFSLGKQEHFLKPSNPIISEFVFADFMYKINREIIFLKDEDIYNIGLVDKLSKSPRVSDENLIYKATSSLYDFILHKMHRLPESIPDPVIENMGIIGDAVSKIKAGMGNFLWSYQVYSSIKRLVDDNMITTFKENFNDDLRIWVPPVFVFVPIICVDAPLFKVNMSNDGEIQDIVESDFLLTSVRLNKWPSVLKYHLLRDTPESLVTVVNIDHLESLLNQISQWFQDICLSIYNVDEDEAIRSILQNAIIRSVYREMVKQEFEHDGNTWHI